MSVAGRMYGGTGTSVLLRAGPSISLLNHPSGRTFFNMTDVYVARNIEHSVNVNAQKNFGKPVEWALVKDHAWSTAQLRKLDVPVSLPVHGRATNLSTSAPWQTCQLK